MLDSLQVGLSWALGRPQPADLVSVVGPSTWPTGPPGLPVPASSLQPPNISTGLPTAQWPDICSNHQLIQKKTILSSIIQL